ncbi:MAG TPA: hypothetical protein VMS65_11535 [Polyangiaceae bacterium]|nr:hypothetical protein [Polyangiaceae bacterium]
MTTNYPGPIEEASFPEQISARVVTPGANPRLHGFDVEGDLAAHYTGSELTLLSLTGELPSEEALAMFEVASAFLAPVSVAHASTHAAVLARLCGATTSTTIGTAAIGLAEQARALLDQHEDLLRWLRKPTDGLPEPFRAIDPEDAASVDRLRTLLSKRGLTVPSLDRGPTRTAALLMLLHAAGIRRRERIEVAIVLSRMPTVIAEALAERPTNFGNYPMNLPRFSYEEG